MDIFAADLTKEYEDRMVLNIRELHIKRGALCGIIGPNGAGKSTLLNLIAGLLKPSRGNLFYQQPGNAEPPYQKMTMVFQKPYLLRTTVEKNIAYPLKLRGWNQEDIKKRVAVLADELGLTEFLKKKSWTLSGGEIQKVALARALSFSPGLLLLDEPTANVDPGTTAEIEKMLKKINEEEGTTVIIVTHNLVQARRLCKEVIFMNQGEIIEFTTGEKMLKSPEHPLTQKFIAGELLL
ncbi:ABC transporter ATP-binding protein [Sinanaerobacter chloroacetimidivorans]|uniref:ABC transporter ATP-binding protein n=1 Tax=Sinanaerobacter chloroacetimidivorans TaxID=2818044 RepID=A0A8J8B164_9FIRM|nr:ABC transporter ATP-binding protein [Sinanaerobacter chloroacetimidivorans]MBR0597924.1 ABC transporter ATP-binding protein [Sinanaerobacter chloroacetimidivorans]